MSELSVSHAYAHPPEAVFDAWLDPARAARFLFATPTGTMVRAELDPRVGGRFVFVDRRPEHGDLLHEGEFLEIDRPRRLVFSFTVPQYDEGTTPTVVTIEIAPAPGGCRLTLSHGGVLPEWEAQTRQGWTMILQALQRTLED